MDWPMSLHWVQTQVGVRSVSTFPISDIVPTCESLMICPSRVSLSICISKPAKWFCTNSFFEAKVFTARFEWLLPHRQRTVRLDAALRVIAFSTNCIEAAHVTRMLGMPVSHDTLLCLIHTTEIPTVTVPFVGIDDFTWKKGHRYGILICDVMTHHPIDLLPDREAETLTNWLGSRPELTHVTRNRYPHFQKAISTHASNVIQIHDRFHLIQNLWSLHDQIIRKILSAQVDLSTHLPRPDPPLRTQTKADIQQVENAGTNRSRPRYFKNIMRADTRSPDFEAVPPALEDR